jgi:hypothetical protein
MPQWTASLIAALIGAGVGSIGAVLVGDARKQRAERAERRELLVQRYLFQLQDSAESLWYRLKNLTYEEGRLVMEDQYFETTTLYALGRALAAERLLALDGVYPQLETLYPGLGSFLIKNQIDLALGEGFYKYDRLVLAEAVMQRDGDRLRVSTYIEFRGRYEGQRESETEWLAPARGAIESITPESTKLLRKRLENIALRLSNETGIPTALQNGSSKDAGVAE